MPPRTILYTGKGGVGKTSVAAATARRCADRGLRTVVMSTDPAHSLSDSLGQELGPDPSQITPMLWGQEILAAAEMRRNWDRVSSWLTGLLLNQGVDRIRAEELTVPPGMDELFSLLQIKSHWDADEFDVVIVDCAPSGETLRLLGFPEVAQWWVKKAFPFNRGLLGAAAPLARALDLPLPDPELMEEVDHLVKNLLEMDTILRDHDHCSIRLVMNPDRMVINEARRTYTYLCLYGYQTDAVVVNRIFPDEVAGTYFGAWRDQQEKQLDAVADGFAPVPILTSRFFEEEVIGEEMHGRLSDELFGDQDPASIFHPGLARELTSNGDSTVIRIAAPFVEKDQIDLKQVGDELIVTVGDVRRTIILPSGLAQREPSRAAFDEGTLEVTYEDV
ncbi:MAG: ArsA family ATPase, partial [Solirubrobacterales bacterium]